MDWVMRLELPYKRQTQKNYKEKFSTIKNKIKQWGLNLVPKIIERN
jgi:uncharacterized protein (DUF302 family)